MASDPKDIVPEEVLREIIDAIPAEVRRHVIIIGSLAAAYGLLRTDPGISVRTKDVDSVLSPRGTAPEKGQRLRVAT